MSWTYRLLHVRKSLSLSCIWNFSMLYHQETLEQEVKGLEERVLAIQQLLGDLKVQLYAKFGDNINLEADESWVLKQTLTAAPMWTLNAALVSDPRSICQTQHEVTLDINGLGLQRLAFVYTPDVLSPTGMLRILTYVNQSRIWCVFLAPSSKVK